jgi:signal transduction histidine kinase
MVEHAGLNKDSTDRTHAAREDVRLAREQAALRRVATLVAEGATADELYAAVAREVAQVLAVSAALLDRYEPDGSAITLAASWDPDWAAAARLLHAGTHWPPDPGSLTAIVHETGRAARTDDYASLTGTIGEVARIAGFGSGCSAPIVVDGNLWGALRVYSRGQVHLPADIEERLHGFGGLVATAVSNAAARAELIASRARIVAAGDDARRRVERNLHDGTQQRLLALRLDVQRARTMLRNGQPDVDLVLAGVEDDLKTVLDEVRELSRGLHPPLLARGGIRPALRALARRSPVPVELDIDLPERPPAPLETAVYYVVSEAINNAIKHAGATTISVSVSTDHGGGPFGVGLDGRQTPVNLHATISDDGIGGAQPGGGSGLVGLVDRVDALGGRLALDSPAGRGTRISVELPLTGYPSS